MGLVFTAFKIRGHTIRVLTGIFGPVLGQRSTPPNTLSTLFDPNDMFKERLKTLIPLKVKIEGEGNFETPFTGC